MQMCEAFSIIESKVAKLAHILVDRALEFKDVPSVGRTHGQHASIISFGLKFAVWQWKWPSILSASRKAKSAFFCARRLV